jgi:aspartate/tyrosine/aromatic aminotransferase
MFLLTGLNKQQVEDLGNEAGVFLPANGRLTVPGLNDDNVEFVAQAIATILAKP